MTRNTRIPTQQVVEAIQKDCNIKIQDIIQNNDDLSTPYRNKNPIFIGYLLQHDNMLDFVKFLRTDAQKADHKKIQSLLQSNNTCLHRTFADSSELGAEMLKVFHEGEEAKRSYAMGTYSKILTRAFDQWPQEMWQVFWSNPQTLPEIIQHLDLSCVVQEIQDKFNDSQYPHICILMWNIFLAFAGPDFVASKDPIFTANTSYIPVDNIQSIHGSLTSAHKKNIVFLLTEYIKSSPQNNELFYDAIYRYIVAKLENVDVTNESEDVTFAFRLFEVAKLIDPKIYDRWNYTQSPYNAAQLKETQQKTTQLCIKLLFKLFDVIQQTVNPKLETRIQSVLLYLTSWTKILDLKLAEAIVYKSFAVNASQIRLLYVLNIVQSIIIDNLSWFATFKEDVEVLIYHFSRTYGVESPDNATINPAHILLLDNAMTMHRLLSDSDFIQSSQSENENNSGSIQSAQSDSEVIQTLPAGELDCWSHQQFIELQESTLPSDADKTIIPIFHCQMEKSDEKDGKAQSLVSELSQFSV